MDEPKIRKKLTDLIKAGEVNLEDCVIIVPLEMYEQLLEAAEVMPEEHVLVYHNGVRIMWDANIKNPILVTKEVYNQKYNPCSDFVKLV